MKSQSPTQDSKVTLHSRGPMFCYLDGDTNLTSDTLVDSSSLERRFWMFANLEG